MFDLSRVGVFLGPAVCLSGLCLRLVFVFIDRIICVGIGSMDFLFALCACVLALGCCWSCVRVSVAGSTLVSFVYV